MKTIHATLLATVLVGLATYGIHMRFTAEGYEAATLNYRAKLTNIVGEVNSKKTTWTAGENDRWNYMGVDAIKG